MKTLEWLNFLAEQRESYGKVIFSVSELANAARTTLHSVNTELGRLIKRGIIARYAKGYYGLVKAVEPEHLLYAIDRCAYITGFAALFHNKLVTQIPSEITCFTNRRHNRTLGGPWKLRFITVPPPIYDMPKKSVVVSGEQALCDFVWLCSRKGLQAQHLVTFRNLDRLKHGVLKKCVSRYPDQVRGQISNLPGLDAVAA